MINKTVQQPHKGSTTICIKIGGNALLDEQIKLSIAAQVRDLVQKGFCPVIIHGGGIKIKKLLDNVSLESNFIGGHRVTDEQTIGYVEMALSGSVNKEITAMLNQLGVKAVGISGRDANLVTAVKRYHTDNGKKVDLGFVGDTSSADTTLILHLIKGGYVPVISPVSSGEDGKVYNINADMFAGFVAGELHADKLIFLTNIDGLLKDLSEPDSLIKELTPEQARSLFGTVIQGGMIPKIEACLIAIEKGVKSVHIVNGTKEGNLLRIFSGSDVPGTTIYPK